MKFRRYWLILMASTAVGLASGTAWPPPPLPKLAADNTEWVLPSSGDIPRHSPQDMAEVTAKIRWHGNAGSAQQGKSEWRLAGILEDAEQAVLVTPAADPSKPERIVINGELPDGSRLVAVKGDRVKSLLDKCTTTYQLFQAQPIERSPECEEPDIHEQGTRK